MTSTKPATDDALMLGALDLLGQPVAGGDDALFSALLADGLTAGGGLAEPPAAGGAAMAALQARISASVSHAGRLEVHAPLAAAVLGASARRARQVLRLVDDGGAWLQIMPELATLHLRPEPVHADADVGLVRLAAGASFPFHSHAGGEETLVLEGELIDEHGVGHGPGSRLRSAPGSAHAVSAGPAGVVYLAVVRGLAIPGWDLPELPPELLR